MPELRIFPTDTGVKTDQLVLGSKTYKELNALKGEPESIYHVLWVQEHK